jgi:hypothetical protein
MDTNVPTLGYEEAGYNNYPGFSSGADVRRKKSMVRPERERIEPGHRQYYYREHAAEDKMRVHPSGKLNNERTTRPNPQPPVTSPTLLDRAAAVEQVTSVEASRFLAATRTRTPTSRA